MGNFDKRLKKAKDLYDKKDFKEALKICDKILEKEYNNEEALELEGELLFKLGRIEEAVLNWQINAEYNNNATAKMRLEDVDDETKQRALNLTLNLNNLSKIINSEAKKLEDKKKKEAENANIKENIKKEITKEEKHTNSDIKEKPINKKPKKEVKNNNSNASTKDIKETVSSSNSNTFKDDKDIAKDSTNESKKEVKGSKEKEIKNVPEKESTNNTEKKAHSLNKGKKSAIIAACAIIVVVSSYVGIKNFSSPSTSNTNQEQSQDATKVSSEQLNKQFADATSQGNIDEVYTLLNEHPENTIPQDVKDNYDKAVELMKTKGVEKYYNDGLDQFKFKSYDKALDDFTKAYTYCGGTYLEPHVLYFLGTTYYSLDKQDDGVKYFQEYLDKYPHSDLYTAEVLYNLAIYYHNKGDNDKAKQYAQRIENSYPSSPYYNDVTKDILYK